MALVKLGDKAVGSIVKLKVNGAAKEFIVVHQGLPGSMYDASCDGTWVLMKDCYEKRKWNSEVVNKYESSEVDAYLNSTFLGLLDANIQAVIKMAKIPYRRGGGTGATQSGANGLARKIFLLGAPEVNLKLKTNTLDTNEGTALSYFASCYDTSADSKRIAYFNGSATRWWLRTPCKNSIDNDIATRYAWCVYTDGQPSHAYSNNTYGIRPAMILPSDLWVSDDGAVATNTAPATPPSLTVPSQINGGATITLSWGAAADAEGNLEGYKAERSLDGGTTWSQIYQGGGTNTTNTVPFGTETVMYRVKAYDSEGLESTWRTSAQVTVINNTAPTVPGSITVPETVQGGRPLTISWDASSDGENNLAGYSLERQVDGGDWAAVYSGDQLSFTDSVIKGWLSVAYRVRAFDTASAYSGFAISETRQVNNNTPPAITCGTASGSNLGTKDEGFTVPYSVDDEDGDSVSVTEAIDGVELRTFSATLGESNAFAVTGDTFFKLLNGTHVMTASASDGKASALHKLTFTKKVTEATVTLAEPMEADSKITICVLSVAGSIPADAVFQVEVTNNANDDAPVWEDCTAEVRNGGNHIFTNETADNGFAFNFRVKAKRGASDAGGYISSVQGGFQ